MRLYKTIDKKRTFTIAYISYSLNKQQVKNRGLSVMVKMTSVKRFSTAAVFATALPLVSLFAVFAQSLKVENPAPLKAGSNHAVIDSFGGEQFWTFTATGPFKLAFARSGAQEGFNIAKCGAGAVFAPKTTGAKMSFVENQAGTIWTGEVTQPTRVVIMIEPAKSALVRQTNDYTLEASGAVSYSPASTSASTSVTGTYTVGLNDWGAAKFNADGSIITTSGANGTWQLFDADTRTYIITINGNKMTMTFQPGRGFVDNNNILTFTCKRVEK